jgi:formate dehydrogenase subunit gamma
LQEQQLATLWHSIMGVFLVCVIIGHIYIGSLGMEGAFDAMGSGEVDLNWAREHHSLWVEEVQAREGRKDGQGPSAQPAE